MTRRSTDASKPKKRGRKPRAASREMNIEVRAYEDRDCEDAVGLFTDPTCQRETLQLPLQSRDDIIKKLQSPPSNLIRLVAVVQEPRRQRVVGMLGIHRGQGRRAHTAELGIFIYEAYQGRGIGSALMRTAIDLSEKWLFISRLELTVYVENDRARALYEKFGFEIEGTLRKYALKDGDLVDTYFMARLSPS